METEKRQRKRFRYSPAATELMLAGVTTIEVGADQSLTSQAISKQLTGLSPITDNTVASIETRGGPRLAARVRALANEAYRDRDKAATK